MDLTVVATPGYFATMGAEYRYLKKRAEREGPSAADYEKNDTIASLTMGVASLVVPFVMPKLLRPITPGKGKFGKALVATAAAAVAVTTIADAVARRNERDDAAVAREPEGTDAAPTNRSDRRRTARSRAASPAWVASPRSSPAGWRSPRRSRHALTADRMWKRRRTRDLGAGPLAVAAAVLAWDFIYYWNHRFMHESRYMWAIHVVHHSSERYNLSTALRQPVADAVGTFLPVQRALPGRVPPRARRDRRAASTCSTSTGSTPTRSAGSDRSSRC